MLDTSWLIVVGSSVINAIEDFEIRIGRHRKRSAALARNNPGKSGDNDSQCKTFQHVQVLMLVVAQSLPPTNLLKVASIIKKNWCQLL